VATIQVLCEACGKPMVERVNRATNEGFLGCSQYPTCTHTMPLPEHLKLERAGYAQLPGF
jgi:ssDNA-binding Zn-finger/Zn-ribbon topoisomerase 1